MSEFPNSEGDQGRRRRVSFAVVIVALLMVGVLRAAGRLWWCACATPLLWVGDVNSSHLSQHLFDPYSFSHLLHGVVFYGMLWILARRIPYAQRLLVALVLEAGWEILENSPFIIDRYRQSTMALQYYGDSIVNSVGDLLSCALGFWVASLLRWWRSVALVVLVEVGMLVLYRDNLTLNVLMLVAPSESIKAWQLQGGGTASVAPRHSISP